MNKRYPTFNLINEIDEEGSFKPHLKKKSIFNIIYLQWNFFAYLKKKILLLLCIILYSSLILVKPPDLTNKGVYWFPQCFCPRVVQWHWVCPADSKRITKLVEWSCRKRGNRTGQFNWIWVDNWPYYYLLLLVVVVFILFWDLLMLRWSFDFHGLFKRHTHQYEKSCKYVNNYN